MSAANFFRALAPVVVISVAGLAAPQTAFPAVIRVCPDGSGDAPTIAAAYAMAVPPDEIVLCPGTYFEHDISMKSSIDLSSESDNPADTVVDAQGLGRCFDGTSVSGYPIIRSITLQNGTHPVEGGLLLAAASPGGSHRVRYENCVFRNGSAPRGGAVAMHASAGQSPYFLDCVFEGNEATTGDGGAIWADYSPNLGFARCTFRVNVAAGHGGAVFGDEMFWNGMDFGSCVFEFNSAGGNGGAVYSAGSGDEFLGSALTGCRFEGNQATDGGAVHVGDGPPGWYSYLSIGGCLFLNNVAAQEGGAAVLRSIRRSEDGGPVARNLFANNSAGARGGALAIFDGLSLGACTLVGNGAPSGGHLWVGSGTAVIGASILAFSTEGEAAAGIGTAQTNCLDVYGNAGGDYVGSFAGQGQIAGNFSEDPLFCNREGGDYTLAENSPCAPPGITGCGRVGRYDVGCGAVSVERVSWGRLKGLYR